MPDMRLIDLHCDWLLQYAAESTIFDPALYLDIPGRLDRVEGYLGAVSAAVLVCTGGLKIGLVRRTHGRRWPS